MSLQGPMIVVADLPAGDLVEALGAAGAFPIVEMKWTDAPTAFVAVKPAAVVIAEPGPPPSEAAARMLCLQIATATGPIVPVVARAQDDRDPAVPIALPIDAGAPFEHLLSRLRSALRVRALHATVLRRIESFAAQGGKMPELPVGDALEDATVLIAGRGPLYPLLGTAFGERVGMAGALSIEGAVQQLTERDIDGIVMADGFAPRMVEALLTVLAQDARFREIPIGATGDVPADLAERLPNIVRLTREPARAVARMLPLLRLYAFEARLKRMLRTLETDGMFDPETGLLARESFWHELRKAIDESANRGGALSIARLALSGEYDRGALRDSARALSRHFRNIDFAHQEDDGAIVVTFTQTDLRSAHVVARRLAGALKNAMREGRRRDISANVTIAAFRAGDNIDSLMMRVRGGEVVAAE
jgi:GGDEF domain-containing protein